MAILEVLLILSGIVSSMQTTLFMNLSQSTCINENAYYDDTSDGIPYCTPYPDPINVISETYCPPGYLLTKRCSGRFSQYECETDEDCTVYGRRIYCDVYCGADGGSCMSYHINNVDFENTYYEARFKPDCLNDASWAPKQCKGDRCLCFAANGERIFGEALLADAADMTCACSRRKHEILEEHKDERIFGVGIHCDTNGNYEKLQCDSGQCWCVEPKTGQPTAPFVPEKAMDRLHCYSATDVGTQYLRKCESQWYAIQKITFEMERRGITHVNYGTINCDYDGSYGHYIIDSTLAYCTARDGSKIETYSSAASDLANLNCNCARDYATYKHNLLCTGSGNYETVQQIGNSYYCLDADGYAKSDALSSANSTICATYY